MGETPKGAVDDPVTSPKAVGSTKSIITRSAPIKELHQAEIAPYLASYGYAALSALKWRPQTGSMPTLELTVTGHQELKGHTWYSVDCSLVSQEANGQMWSVMHRLEHLRDELHNRVKHECGQSYAQQFGDTPFAHKGGLPGTTARLTAWFSSLSRIISEGKCNPGLVAYVLTFLEAPELDHENVFESMPALQVTVGGGSKPHLSKSLFGDVPVVVA